ncbi:MAG: TetR family transcriptional regulator [Actinobacteria bacterium]|nr:TetR family transcriptional regulator [Actinomycetota bacterium]
MTAAAQPRRGGRRRGESGTREAILAAARAAFAELGFDRATIRGIAAAAGVDPALVLHYFGSKEQLFGDALQIPMKPGEVLRQVMEQRIDDMGATLVRTFLEAWEPEESRAPLVAMVRSAMTNETALALVRDYLGRRVFGPITQALAAPDAELRATLMGSQFIGLAMMRYIAHIEPLASASVEQLVTAIGPTMQRYLSGDLGSDQSVDG